MSSFKFGIVVLAVVAGTGCALNASPAEGLRFQPPAGWRPSPAIMGFMQFWRSPLDDREVLMLFKSPRPLQEHDVFSNAQLHDTLRDVTIEQRRAIAICGRQPAMYVAARGSSARSERDRVEMVMTTSGGNSYFALYVRPLAAAPDPMAEAALRELCAKP